MNNGQQPNTANDAAMAQQVHEQINPTPTPANAPKMLVRCGSCQATLSVAAVTNSEFKCPNCQTMNAIGNTLPAQIQAPITQQVIVVPSYNIGLGYPYGGYPYGGYPYRGPYGGYPYGGYYGGYCGGLGFRF